MNIDLTVLVPVFNEEAIIDSAIRKVCTRLEQSNINFELLLVDDGSTDSTRNVILEAQKKFKQIRLIHYYPNAGRGTALRKGFLEAAGDIVISIDSDLSYNESHIVTYYQHMQKHPETDMVLGSAYMKGGVVKGVPLTRLIMSKVGNKILSFALKGEYKTITCVLRGYRQDKIKSLDLISSGKEIHLEILLKAIAYGFKIDEIPASLIWGKKRNSKFRFRATSISHLLFSLTMRPMILFGFVGALMIFLGTVFGIYIIILWLQQTLNPERPLINLMIILLLGGVQMISLGILAFQLSELRRDLIRMQKLIRDR